MPRFLFYSREGLTYTPCVLNEYEEYEGGNEVENLQVIGFADGDTPQEAFDHLLFTHSYLEESTFDQILAIELKGKEFKNYEFSLNTIREQQEAL